ncbi:MAG: chemotaxis protein CheA [Steroidobacteraceae bacterium]
MTVDLTQFHAAFFEESVEALDSMEAALLKLDVGTPDAELINTIFRVAHSIKGGSATFGFKEIASFTHSLETLLDELRGQRLDVSQSLLDLLLKSVDVMRGMLSATQTQQPIDAQLAADVQFDIELAINARPQPKSEAGEQPMTAVPEKDATPAQAGWSIRFSPWPELLANGNDPLRIIAELEALGSVSVHADLSRLTALADLAPDNCLLQWVIEVRSEVTREVIEQVFEWAEGECSLVIEALAAGHEAGAAKVAVSAAAAAAIDPGPAVAETVTTAAAAIASPASQAKPAPAAKPPAANADAGSIRVGIEKIDELMNTVGELVITQSMLTQLALKAEGPMMDRMREGLAQLERNMRELQDSVMRVRMLPISFVFSRFPRMVRDLAQKLGKSVELKITGENTELDKTVMEKIGDPLVHLVRNSIDHGLELPADRQAAGKPSTGTVSLNAFHRGGNIVIEVSDDGRGLAREKILAKARARNLVGANDVLTDAQINELIFMPGFSTVDQATDVSGRGVGMDVVRRNISELGGAVELRSETGKGSCFTISLPLTLAIVDGQTVDVGGQTYIVPLLSIIESLQLKPGTINRIAGGNEVFSFRGEYLPIVRLYEVFGVKPRTRELTEGLVMVVEGDGRRIGLFVDELLGQQQVVIKSMETNYRRIDGVAGATILGDGEVALILDLAGLVRLVNQRIAA